MAKDKYITLYDCTAESCGKQYIIESCCNGYALCLMIYTLETIIEGYLNLKPKIKYWEIIDGKVKWDEADYHDPIIIGLMPAADDIAAKTGKLLKRAKNLSVFA
jgi:hypothetical protein